LHGINTAAEVLGFCGKTRATEERFCRIIDPNFSAPVPDRIAVVVVQHFTVAGKKMRPGFAD
jgi:hypothetical protein